MEQNNKDTYGFTLVAIGLLIGFFLGAGIVYWYSNRPKEAFIAGNTFDHISKLWQTADELVDEVINYTHIIVSPPITDDSSQIQMSSNKEAKSIAENQLPENHTHTIPDTLAIPEREFLQNDSLLVADGQNDSEISSVTYIAEHVYDVPASAINVRKEELIGIREFLLPSNYDNPYQSAETQILDSLIGRPQISEKNRNSIFIEFWESPLNYTRYRMTKNRIVIYGIHQIDYVSLTKIDNKLFLKYNEDFFSIEATMNFKPLIPVNDPFLVNKSEQ